ncbi:MAG: hypothetical protein JNM69_15840 [Archangium sp.]|nr:hypothetical protein [Archangium sp.]
MRFLIFTAVAVVGCDRPVAQTRVLEAPAPVTTCASVDGAALGQLPLNVALGDETIAFAEWSVADEQSTEVVGFAAHLPGDVKFTVKAGDDEYTSASPRWLHPRGVSGPRVHPVERITFCRTVAPQIIAAR